MFAVLVALALGGCSDSPAEPSAATGTASASSGGSNDGSQPDSGPVDSCEVVTLDQLSEALGKEVIFDPGANRDPDSCLYISTGAKPIVLSISAEPANGSADEVIGETLELFEEFEPIDIGEAGYIGFGSQVGFVQAGIEYQVNLGAASVDVSRELTIVVARLIESNN